jgi:DNA polymerase-3 subunit beta
MTLSNPILEHSSLSTHKKGLKVTVLRSELVTLMGKMQSAIPPKPVVPILSNLLLEAAEGQLILSATDLTVSVKAFTEATVSKKGSIAVSAKRFFQLIRELTTSHIELEVDSSNLIHIKAGSSTFKLHGIDTEEFPSFPDYRQYPCISLHAPTLKELFIRTAFAVAKEDSRHMLNGILLHLTQDTLTLVGTDGKRLAKINGEIASQNTQGQYIVPIKAIEEMIRCLDEDVEVKLYLGQDKITIETTSVVITTKLLSGEYPDVNRVIPSKATTTVHLHREELITLLRQVALFTSETMHSVHFIFTPGELELSVISSEVGEGRVSMPVDYSGDRFEIAFNPNFFIDILRHCKDETVTLGITDSFNPGMITDQTTALFVIMPMRLQN